MVILLVRRICCYIHIPKHTIRGALIEGANNISQLLSIDANDHRHLNSQECKWPQLFPIFNNSGVLFGQYQQDETAKENWIKGSHATVGSCKKETENHIQSKI